MPTTPQDIITTLKAHKYKSLRTHTLSFGRISPADKRELLKNCDVFARKLKDTTEILWVNPTIKQSPEYQEYFNKHFKQINATH